MSILHEKTGSDSPLKQFTYLLKKIIQADSLPDYALSFVNAADGSPAVHFIRRGAAERAKARAELATLQRESEKRAREDARSEEVDAMFERRRVRHSDDD